MPRLFNVKYQPPADASGHVPAAEIFEMWEIDVLDAIRRFLGETYKILGPAVEEITAKNG